MYTHHHIIWLMHNNFLLNHSTLFRVTWPDDITQNVHINTSHVLLTNIQDLKKKQGIYSVNFLLQSHFLINTLTANYKYSRSNRENLPLPIQIQLSEKLNKNFKFLLLLWNLHKLLNIFLKNELHCSNIFEVIDSEKRAYLNA